MPTLAEWLGFEAALLGRVDVQPDRIAFDLADGRDFVANFAERINRPARAANLLAVSGASTLPALSSAVIDNVLRRLAEVEEIRIVIAPPQRTWTLRKSKMPCTALSGNGKSLRYTHRLISTEC